MTGSRRLRFNGHIAGVGTQEGTRLVLGCWSRTPHGPFADVMVERADGHRILLAPDPWVADFVTNTYTFDDVEVVEVKVHRSGTQRGSLWSVSAGPVSWEFSVGSRTALGHLLRAVPPVVGTTLSFARLTNVVASQLLPGVQTLGSAGQGRTEWYAAHDLHRLTGSDVKWDGQSLGTMTSVTPPPRFGFSSTPQMPSVTAVTTTVALPES